MRVDKGNTRYHEADTATKEFDRAELKRLRFLLRRLRFLETNISEHEGADATSNAAVFAATEVESLEWLLSEVGYLDITDKAAR